MGGRRTLKNNEHRVEYSTPEPGVILYTFARDMGNNEMKNFTTVYKGALKKILVPQGYTNWRSFFYKAEEELFFLINGKRVAGYSQQNEPTHFIELSIGALPYCEDLETSFYELSDGILSFEDILRRLTIDKMSKADFRNYINGLTDAKDEEISRENIEIICREMQGVMLPYVHGFTDLEFFYREWTKELRADIFPTWGRGGAIPQYIYLDATAFGIAVKLRKYEDAVTYVDEEMFKHQQNIKYGESRIEAIKNGDTLYLSKHFSVEQLINSAERGNLEQSIIVNKWQKMKDALNSRDHSYLDSYLKETEKRSRIHLQKLFEGHLSFD